MDNKKIAALVKSLQNFSFNAEKLINTRYCEESHLIDLDYDDSIQLDFDIRLKKEEFTGDSATIIIRKCDNLLLEITNEKEEEKSSKDIIESINTVISIMTSIKNAVGELNCDNKSLKNSLKTIKILSKAMIEGTNKDKVLDQESSLAA